MNCEKLKNKVNESGLKVTSIAEWLGISREALYKKMNGVNEFKASEIRKLTSILLLTAHERDEIFFSEE